MPDSRVGCRTIAKSLWEASLTPIVSQNKHFRRQETPPTITSLPQSLIVDFAIVLVLGAIDPMC